MVGLFGISEPSMSIQDAYTCCKKKSAKKKEERYGHVLLGKKKVGIKHATGKFSQKVTPTWHIKLYDSA